MAVDIFFSLVEGSYFMKLKLLIQYFHTLRYVKFEQLIFRLYYICNPFDKKIPKKTDICNSNWVWNGPQFNKQSFFGSNHFVFLSKSSSFNKEISWNDASHDKLWIYNLHYFDDLNSFDFYNREKEHLALISSWIKDNPPFLGNGWEPYPLSLRIVNWVKWYNRAGIKEPSVVHSLFEQATALTKQLEYHILGNHLFANGKALVFAGTFLQGAEAERFLDIGLKILKREIPEQFLEDGGHFELSPMYHCILLLDLLELIQLSSVTQHPKLKAQEAYWRAVAQKALNWLTVMRFPDGEVSFFNDSAIGIAAAPKQLFDYAQSLGFSATPAHTTKLQTLAASGYSKVIMPKHVLLFDHAQVGPDYLPGHAHADTLSFEWSVGLQRVFVNSGTSIYGVSAERLRQRKTAAHNTIVVDDEDSSEVWSGFRVARRAKAILKQAVESATEVVIQASHDGYRRLKGNVTHQRTITVSASKLVIDDMLSGSFTTAIAHFHLHPDIVAQQIDHHRLQLSLPNGEQISFVSTGMCKLVTTTWHPRFGHSIPNQKIEVKLSNSTLATSITLL